MNKGPFQTIVGAALALLSVLGWAETAFSQGDRGAALKELGKVSHDTAQASKLMRSLQADVDLQILEVLEAMRGADDVAQNWYLSLAQTVAARDSAKAQQVLEQFLPRLSEEPNARYWAFRYLTSGDAEKREALLSSMLTDPCLELRYEAVELALEQAKESELADAQLVGRYQELLAAARLPSQVDAIAGLLEEKGVEVDLLKHYGFLADWQTVGVFDNSEAEGRKGFAEVFAPEKEYAAGGLDISGSYTSKNGDATWKPVRTEAKDGAVDLATFFEKEKGAVAYSYAEFDAAADVECEVRIGSPNACKVWVNGEPCIAREVYHSGNQVDQYSAPVKLRAGKNTILVKTCQNEQTQPWAQDWLFQLRFTDRSGLAIQPAE